MAKEHGVGEKEEMSDDLDQETRDVRNAFDGVLHPLSAPSYAGYVEHVFEDYVIICANDGAYWKAGYTRDGDKIVPAPQLEWKRVEQAWEETGKETETMTTQPVKPEEFAEKLTTANGEIERLKAEGKTSAEKLVAAEQELGRIKLSGRKAALKAEAEAFAALPIKPDEYVERFVALEDAAPDVAKWLKELFAAFDTAMKEAGLLREVGSERSGEKTKADMFLARVDAKHKEIGGKPEQYAEALEAVQREHPDLARAYRGEKEE